MKKHRLLFLISRFLDGGIDTILVEYLRNIDLGKFEVTLAIGIKMEGLEVHLSKIPAGVKVVYLNDAPALTRWRREKISRRLPLHIKIYDELLLNPMRSAVASRRLRRLVENCDEVIDFDATFYTVLRNCPRPVTGFYHFSIDENLRRSPRHTRRQMEGMARYNRIALISDIMVEEGKRLFPSLTDKFVRIYNGYNFNELRRRAEAPLPEMIPATPYIVSVARMEESQKDNTTLLKAYRLMLDRLPATATAPHLVLVGEGRDRMALQQLAADLGIAQLTTFTGFISDAAPVIGRSLGLVLSSKYEGFGLVLVEAMILGRPVIATDCPSGPAEILQNGKAGLLVPPSDTEALADALTVIATDKEARRHLAEAATARGADFDIHNSVNQLLSPHRP